MNDLEHRLADRFRANGDRLLSTLPEWPNTEISVGDEPLRITAERLNPGPTLPKHIMGSAPTRTDGDFIVADGDFDGRAIFDAIKVVAHRPPAFVTIDDRGLRFEGEWPSLDELAAFVPWNKRPKPTPAGRMQPTVPATLAPAPATPPLDGFQLDDRMADIFTEEWNKLVGETGGKAPPDFWTPEGQIGFQPHLWTARIAGRVDELIGAEVEKRLKKATETWWTEDWRHTGCPAHAQNRERILAGQGSLNSSESKELADVRAFLKA